VHATFTDHPPAAVSVAPMGRRTAYLHIGPPRSGGAFLDSALAEHAEALEVGGLRHPAISAEQMFRAAIEIRRDTGRGAADDRDRRTGQRAGRVARLPEHNQALEERNAKLETKRKKLKQRLAETG
jgi:hypothetical protein